MKKEIPSYAAKELVRIYNEMQTLMYDLDVCLRCDCNLSQFDKERAKAYWLAKLRLGLDADGFATMDQTFSSFLEEHGIDPNDEDQEFDDDDDDDDDDAEENEE